jgi:hypothetical protein
MQEKILWRTPQIKSSILFFLLSPWWLYLMYCFSFSQSIFSVSAFKIVIFNYWWLFLSSMLIALCMHLLWLPAAILAGLHALVTFYFSSIFLFATTNKLYLSFNIIFFISSGLNILFWLRDSSLACYQKKHYQRGFFGKILKHIDATLVLPPSRYISTNEGENKIESINVELVDWDEDSVKMKLKHAPHDLDFLAEFDLMLKINYQKKEYVMKAHATVWNPLENILGIRIVKDEKPAELFGTDFEAFYKLSQKLGHDPKLLY